MERLVNSIICGDCMEVLPTIEDNFVDLVLFSPPYDNIRDYNKKWSINFLSLGKELYRITKDGGVAAVVINDSSINFAKTLTTFRLAVNWVDLIGWNLFETIIYKRHGRPGAWWTKRFRVDHEYILIFFKGNRPKYFNKEHLMVESKHANKIVGGTQRLTNGDLIKIVPKQVNKRKCRGTVWEYSASNSERNKLKLQHPATFPDALARDLILCFSEPGDLVIDPMCGSGTTCVMAKLNNRNFIGIDISEDYCDIARKRINSEERKEI